MKEKWKWVRGFKGRYKIYNTGKVYSVRRFRLGKAGYPSSCGGRWLKLSPDHDGYHRVTLCKRGQQFTRRVARLVAEAFVPNPNNLPEVNHIDTNKVNNWANNLEWVDDLEQTQHAARNGLLRPPRGNKHPFAKLNRRLVRWLKENYIPRHPVFGQAALARQLGVSQSILSCAINEKNWTLKRT